MQVELSLEELKTILHWSSSSPEAWKDESLVDRIITAHVEAEELESIDLNACDGGGCTL